MLRPCASTISSRPSESSTCSRHSHSLHTIAARWRDHRIRAPALGQSTRKQSSLSKQNWPPQCARGTILANVLPTVTGLNPPSWVWQRCVASTCKQLRQATAKSFLYEGFPLLLLPGLESPRTQPIALRLPNCLHRFPSSLFSTCRPLPPTCSGLPSTSTVVRATVRPAIAQATVPNCYPTARIQIPCHSSHTYLTVWHVSANIHAVLLRLLHQV